MYDYDVILSFITAFTLTYFAIPSIIRIARIKNLTDEPGERRSHTESTPSLGGIGIFAGTLFSIMLWTPFGEYGGHLQYILCSFIIIFLIGAKDDIDPISPTKKLIGEILAAAILVFKSNIVLNEGLNDVFGIVHFPYPIAVFITIFTILVIINAFNLIDGINGLSGSIATLICGTLGTWFLFVHRYDLAIVAFSLSGAVIAFLKYNFTPARIFMGDTGALLIGLVCSILTIEFIEYNFQLDPDNPYKINAVPAVAIGILILPLFDTLRVFITRIWNGKSPLYPDRNHIHHLLIDSGLTHMQATAVLVAVNTTFILLVFFLQRHTDTKLLIALIIGVASLLMGGFYFSIARKKKKA
ncbi:MAG: undecaprenyl/decaprenyl-phosphate alpha-N-acetylglucosaminyl 1-phosphate transferase [Bacteroidetes bacterium]|nr:MAG: undecaprenyl/decaprenyl-phosphate alpha-N-acetylglucosaminyl 1-phosphate transferase [Bacteroidota bacterium]